jgi:hypothetical protein
MVPSRCRCPVGFGVKLGPLPNSDYEYASSIHFRLRMWTTLAEALGSQCAAHASISLRRLSSASLRNDVRQRSFGHFARKVCDVPRPIPEAGAEAVNRCVFNFHTAQHHFHRHV